MATWLISQLGRVRSLVGVGCSPFSTTPGYQIDGVTIIGGTIDRVYGDGELVGSTIEFILLDLEVDVTENPAARPSFGRALGQAARTLSKLHHRALAELDSDFPSWMLLTLLNEQASPIPVDTVVAEMDQRIDLARSEVISLLEHTAAAGLVAYRPEDPAPTAGLTQTGSAHFASLYAHSRTVTDAAAEGIDPAMLDTAVTVLLTVEERAISLLGA